MPTVMITSNNPKLNGEFKMKKVKQKKLTKDQQKIAQLNHEVMKAVGQKNDAEYSLEKAQNAKTSAENDLSVTRKKLEATQRKLELVTSEVIATMQLLETTQNDISREQSQRIIGIAQGRLTAAAMLTESWINRDTASMAKGYR